MTVQDPQALFAGQGWIPVLIGAGLALAVHLFKATTRVGANSVTGGGAAPVLSTVEDGAAAALAFAAVLLPLLVVVVLIAVLAGLWWLARRATGRRGDPGMSREDRYFSA